MNSSFPRKLCALAFLAIAGCGDLFADDAQPIRIALFDDAGASGAGVPRVTEILSRTGSFKITKVTGAQLAAGALKDADVVIFTGGSGSKEAASLGEAGREEVREFVRNGGGYVGICAGAYLACSGFSWGLGILDARTVSSKWRRGSGKVEIEVTPEGEALTKLPAARREIRYGNGPILKAAGRTDLPPYEPLAWYRTELAENGTPAGVMVNSPALVRSTFGKGRVLISSPHPEQTDGMEDAVERAVRWVAERPRP